VATSLNNRERRPRTWSWRGRILGGVNKLADCPDVIGDPDRHRRRNSQTLVDPTQIEVGDIKAHGRDVVLQLFREAIRQPRESP
jgi:hypothetical protein